MNQWKNILGTCRKTYNSWYSKHSWDIPVVIYLLASIIGFYSVPNRKIYYQRIFIGPANGHNILESVDGKTKTFMEVDVHN